MTPLAELQALADPARAAEMLAYHKAPRPYLGVSAAAIATLADRWRSERTLEDRIALAADLWRTNIHEARIAAARLLTQARIRPDEASWALIVSWVPDFDAWAIADHASIAGQKRLVADPSRLDVVEAWIVSPHMWTRRAALVMTLPWTRQNFPKAADLAIRDRVLGWCASLAEDPDWFIQKAVAWWLRDLSKHDAGRTRSFLADHGARLKSFARKEAARHLTD
ncbi:DNA alkylation repair protein [Tabrizicola caldifontis]|uniref:DNA alkylation repair protein n=1 Tax=Tabrizicola caldifontis TaxID=2528036 RepID=UPI0010801748|nr:DNA alkylation repair protein [Rhodobacter sp. YIM 73028]